MIEKKREQIGQLKAALSPAKQAMLAKRLQGVVESAPVHQIPRRSPSDPAPLSFAQQRLWLLDQLQPGNAAYNMATAVRLTGSLNKTALTQSLNEIVRRHEILRTTFELAGDQPVQVIAPVFTLAIPEIDLQTLTPDAQNAEVQRLATAESYQPFNLVTGPLLRTTLLQLSATEFVWLLTLHHIVSDGWSMGILVAELAALYKAFSCDQPSPLPDLPIQYADFALWQRQRLQQTHLDNQLAYWRQQLAGALPLLQLPADRHRPKIQTFHGAIHSFAVSPEIATGLKKLSQKAGVTLFMTLLAAFKTLLHRYTGQTDLLVGTPIANRHWVETEKLIGFFVNTLVLRTDVSGDPTFAQLLERVRAVTLGAFAHQDLPFEQLVEALQPQRDLSYTPLFQVNFVLNNEPVSAVELPGLTWQSLENPQRPAAFDLTLYMRETGTGLMGTLEYNTDLFEAGTVTRMAGHLQQLLAGIVACPQQRVSEFSLLTDAEKYQLLVTWNQTQVDYPHPLCLHQLFDAQVAQTPDAIAVVFDEQKLTYQQLKAKANQLAHYLQRQGVQPEILVGICLERSLEMVVGLLGILKAGGAYVPLDPTYPKDRLAFMLADAQVSILLTQTSVLQTLSTVETPTICLDREWTFIAQESQENLVHKTDPDHLAYVIYTSGSTGKPKGAMNTHKGICNRLLWMQEAYKLTAGDRVLQKTPFSFDVSVWEFFWPLITGACLVMAQPAGHQDRDYLIDLIRRQQITTLHFVPSMLQIFLEGPGVESCHSLKRVICSGEALPLALQHRFFSQFNHVELHNLYGPTEAAIDVTFWACQSHNSSAIVPIGRPIANTQIYILDSHRQPVPLGVPGELYIGGDGLARGYLNRPELTAEKFIPNPFSKGVPGRLYKTGDLARYLPNGTIEFLGRLDHQVKIRGFRIELGEIEAALNTHPKVKETVVIVQENQEKECRLIAYLVGESEAEITPKDLRNFLQSQLPDYMIPAAFVFLEAFPLTPNGKLDRQGLPAPEISQNPLDYVPPRTAIEETLAGICADILKLEKVGIHDNFFELGGHSLLATQVISRLRATFQIELALRSLFEKPTVAGLAERLETLRLVRTQISPVSVSKGRQELEF